MSVFQAKYFDSGDYNMAKSGKQKKDVVIGKAIPTVDQLPQRKQSCSRLSSLVDGEGPPSPTQPDQKIEEQTDEQKTKLQVVENEDWWVNFTSVSRSVYVVGWRLWYVGSSLKMVNSNAQDVDSVI